MDKLFSKEELTRGKKFYHQLCCILLACPNIRVLESIHCKGKNQDWDYNQGLGTQWSKPHREAAVKRTKVGQSRSRLGMKL